MDQTIPRYILEHQRPVPTIGFNRIYLAGPQGGSRLVVLGRLCRLIENAAQINYLKAYIVIEHKWAEDTDSNERSLRCES